eukprot:gene23721-biopygen19356
MEIPKKKHVPAYCLHTPVWFVFSIGFFTATPDFCENGASTLEGNAQAVKFLHVLRGQQNATGRHRAHQGAGGCCKEALQGSEQHGTTD